LVKDFQGVWEEICKEADTNNEDELDYKHFEAAMLKALNH